MRLNVLIGCMAIVTMLSGCSTPQERADAQKRDREYELRKIEQRENSYKDACATYGYEVGTPQFNQCVTTERRQYEAEQRDAQAAEERRAQTKKDKRKRDQLKFENKIDCILAQGVLIGNSCMPKPKCVLCS